MTILNIPVSITKGYKSKSYTNVGDSSSELWDVCHDASGDGSGSDIKAGWNEGVSWNLVLWRAYLQFYTGDIGGGTINSAKLKISGVQSTRNKADDYVLGSASSSTYSDLKTTTDYGTLPSIGTPGGTNNWPFTDEEITLNAAGLAGINKVGDTLLSFRGVGDTTDVFPNGADDYDSLVITSATLIIDYDPLIVAPTVTTQAVSSIDKNTATLNGNITDNGNENATTRGFYLKEGSGTPTSGDTVIDEDGDFGVGAFALGATSLLEGTLYSVVAFATNSEGTSTGETVEFTTTSDVVIRNAKMGFFTMFT